MRSALLVLSCWLAAFPVPDAQAQAPGDRRDRIEQRQNRIEQRERRLERREERLERLQERFDAADADRDGSLSREEARRHFPHLHDAFGDIDRDGDRHLTPGEIRHYWQQRARERRIERQGLDPRY